jgi:hypothetical protein
MTQAPDLKRWEDEFYAAVREYLQTLDEKTQKIHELLAAKPPSAERAAPAIVDRDHSSRETTVRPRVIAPGIYSSAE